MKNDSIICLVMVIIIVALLIWASYSFVQLLQEFSFDYYPLGVY